MKIIKNIPSLPNVEVFASNRYMQVYVLHNISTGHTLYKKEDGIWYEGNTDTTEYWGAHIDDAAGFHSRAESLCMTPVQAPSIPDIEVGIVCIHNVVEQIRVMEVGDYNTAYIPGIGRVIPTDYNKVTVFPPNSRPPEHITGQAAEVITALLDTIPR